LAFAVLASYLKEKMEGQEFLDINQVMQREMIYMNHAKDHRSYSQFRENGSKEREKHNVNCIDEESTSRYEAELCVAELVDTPKCKLISC
jgi:hypothetical protein